jgi:omega-6 fatty acid desaturase (delta-12 desaturase)
MAQESMTVVSPQLRRAPPVWAKTVAQYKDAHLLTGVWQLLNTVVPLALLSVLMYFAYQWSYALVLLISIPTAGFLVRLFILQHDCGHRSFFASRLANDIVGTLCGILTLTPFHYWRRTHARHHATSGNLNHRGHGDIVTLTVNEYFALGPWHRLGYRIYRNPFFMFAIGAPYLFILRQRFTRGIPRAWRRERLSVYVTNLGFVALLLVAQHTIGLTTFALLWFPVVLLGSAIGSFLFYVQHQFEEAYWEEEFEWDFHRAALEGSSYLRLPRVLQWFTSNIGYHHIHHLNSRIPNYHLPACYAAEPEFRQAPTIGLSDSLKCVSLKLWEPDERRMVTFDEAHARRATSIPLIDPAIANDQGGRAKSA